MNLAAWLLEKARGDEVCLVEATRSITYSELGGRARRVAGFLRREAAEAAIVPLIGEASIDWVVAYLGILLAGGVPAPVPPSSVAALEWAVKATRGALAVTVGDARVPGSLGVGSLGVGSLGVRVVDVQSCEGGGEIAAPVATDPRSLAVLLYTSGSTGRPRGVMLSGENLRANALGILDFCPLRADDRALCSLPFFYCYGLSVLHTHLRAGASVAVPRSGFPADVLDCLETTAATGWPGVASSLATFAAGGALGKRRFPSLRYVMASGGKLHDASVRALQAALPGVALFVRYGVTELTAAASYLPPERLVDKLGSIGRGLVDAPLSVERPDGTPVKPGSGEVGEIVGRGAHVALGYLDADGEEAYGFGDGAFRTGDLATVDDDGFVFVVAREKEFVKTAGHRVAPGEVEDVLVGAPGVIEAAVCGVPHTSRGEALMAFVVVDGDAPPSTDALRQHCMAALPPHKVPVLFRVERAMPRTASGKIDRLALRRLCSAEGS